MKKDDFGLRIKESRKKKQMTAEELAAKAGVDRTYISKIERHNYSPSISVIKRISKALDDERIARDYAVHKFPPLHGFIIENPDFKTHFLLVDLAKMNILCDDLLKEVSLLQDTIPGKNRHSLNHKIKTLKKLIQARTERTSPPATKK